MLMVFCKPSTEWWSEDLPEFKTLVWIFQKNNWFNQNTGQENWDVSLGNRIQMKTSIKPKWLSLHHTTTGEGVWMNTKTSCVCYVFSDPVRGLKSLVFHTVWSPRRSFNIAFATLLLPQLCSKLFCVIFWELILLPHPIVVSWFLSETRKTWTQQCQQNGSTGGIKPSNK